MKITGAYAQTELGHGSNVRGLQTTATYDASTEEFVMDTPTLDSMKWWPSNMVMATHCVVYAQMLIGGVEHGVHVFFVQLRDEELLPLPGIEIGDIGTKVRIVYRVSLGASVLLFTVECSWCSWPHNALVRWPQRKRGERVWVVQSIQQMRTILPPNGPNNFGL